MPVNNPPRAQDYDNAHRDLQTVEDVINGPIGGTVISRLGRSIRTLADAIASIVDGTAFVSKLTGIQVYGTYAALTAVSAENRFDDMLVYVRGRATWGDGGQGKWRFVAGSSATANGGTVLAPDSGTGRWVRVIEKTEIMLDWFAAGNAAGAVNDAAPLMAAMAVASSLGFVLRGNWGKIYGVSGQVTVPGPLFWEDTRIRQLTPTSSSSLRTILTNGYDGHRWKHIWLDINGDGSFGSIEDYRGFSIGFGSDMVLEDIRVNGDNLCSALAILFCEDVLLISPNVEEVGYNLDSDPGDDVINGIRVVGGRNIRVLQPKVKNLRGDYGSGLQRRYTRGITVSGGTVGLQIIGGEVYGVDQGIDLTGDAAAVDFLIEGTVVELANSWGVKIANSGARGKVHAVRMRSIGLGGVVVQGRAGDSTWPQDILVEGCSVDGMDATSTFAANENRFFYGVLSGGATGNGRPRNVQFRDNFGSVPAGGTAPNYEFYCDFAASTTNGGPLWSGGETSGASTSKFGGNAGHMRADVTLSASQSISTANESKIAFDSETYDPMGLHDGTGVFTAMRDGLYGYSCTILWDNSATGTRRLVLRKNSTNERGENRQQGENASIGQSQHLSGMIYLSKGDTIQFRGEQTSGGNLNVINTGSRAAFWLISN